MFGAINGVITYMTHCTQRKKWEKFSSFSPKFCDNNPDTDEANSHPILKYFMSHMVMTVLVDGTRTQLTKQRCIIQVSEPLPVEGDTFEFMNEN